MLKPDPAPPFRKTIQHHDHARLVHSLTWSCVGRRPLLTPYPAHASIVLAAMARAAERLEFQVLAYVLMPEHVHFVVVAPPDPSSVSSLLYAIKRPSSERIKRLLEESNPSLRDRLTIRERPGKLAFRFWLEGPGYDRDLNKADSIRAEIEYVHQNPVRRGLTATPGEWEWSSWKQYFVPDFEIRPGTPRVWKTSI